MKKLYIVKINCIHIIHTCKSKITIILKKLEFLEFFKLLLTLNKSEFIKKQH